MLEFRLIEVVDKYGVPTAVQLALCPVCSCDTWIFYLVDGPHGHMQCMRCGKSYCTNDRCQKEVFDEQLAT